MLIRRVACWSVALLAAGIVSSDLDSRSQLHAQVPVAVTTYYAPAPAAVVGQPVVTYTPRRAGLLGLRTVYRPEVGYLLPPAPVMSAPVVGTTTFYAPSAPVMTAPVMTAPAMTAPAMAAPAMAAPAMAAPAMSVPTTTFMVPTAPVGTYSAPPVTAIAPPAPVTTFYVPAVPHVPTQGFSNFLPGY